MKANKRQRSISMNAATIAVLLLLGSCAAPPKAPAPLPPPVIVPSPRPTPAPMLPRLGWRDAPLTPGDWRWSNSDGRSTARFGTANSAAIASFICDRNSGRVLIGRSGGGDAAAPMAVNTSSNGIQPLLPDAALSSPGWLVAAVSARDPILDAIAMSRGRFLLEAGNSAPLILPSWPEISRVIEDCR